MVSKEHPPFSFNQSSADKKILENELQWGQFWIELFVNFRSANKRATANVFLCEFFEQLNSDRVFQGGIINIRMLGRKKRANKREVCVLCWKNIIFRTILIAKGQDVILR